MRINTLALVHRILYEVAEGSQVHLDELLRELAAMLENAMEPPLRIRSDVEDVPVPTDMAVPIALLVEEIVLDLARHSRGQPASFLLQGTLQGRNLHLCLHTDPGVELSAEDIMAEADLAHGFAAQLGGVLSASRDGSLLVVCGDFPCPVPHAARQDPADGVTPAPELSR